MLNKTLGIGTINGVPIKLHWSFIGIILLVGYICIERSLNINQALSFFLMVILLFLCVLFHELGHVLTAKKLNIKANDIIISPIGGLARIESVAHYPLKEILIAVSGPIVNLIIAVILFIYLYFIQGKSISFDPFKDFDFIRLSAYLYFLLFTNILLFALNMIPAFPMDGGRVLRALLTLKYNSLKATLIASVIGRILAVVVIVVAVYTKLYVLIIMGVFIYITATAEYQILKNQSLVNKEKYHDRENKKAGPSFPPTNRPEEDLNT